MMSTTSVDLLPAASSGCGDVQRSTIVQSKRIVSAWASLSKMRNSASVHKKEWPADNDARLQETTNRKTTAEWVIHYPSQLLDSAPAPESKSEWVFKPLPSPEERGSTCTTPRTDTLSPLSPDDEADGFDGEDDLMWSHIEGSTAAANAADQSTPEMMQLCEDDAGEGSNRPSYNSNNDDDESLHKNGIKTRAGQPARDQFASLRTAEKQQSDFVGNLLLAATATATEPAPSTTVEIPEIELEWGVITEIVPSHGEGFCCGTQQPRPLMPSPPACSQRKARRATSGERVEKGEPWGRDEYTPPGLSPGAMSTSCWSPGLSPGCLSSPSWVSAFPCSPTPRHSMSLPGNQQKEYKSKCNQVTELLAFPLHESPGDTESGGDGRGGRRAGNREVGMSPPSIREEALSGVSRERSESLARTSSAKRARWHLERDNTCGGGTSGSSKKCRKLKMYSTVSSALSNYHDDDGGCHGRDGDETFTDLNSWRPAVLPILSSVSGSGASSSEGPYNKLKCFREFLSGEGGDMAAELSDRKILKRTHRSLRSRRGFDHLTLTGFEEDETMGTPLDMDIGISFSCSNHGIYRSRSSDAVEAELRSRTSSFIQKQRLARHGYMLRGSASACGDSERKFGDFERGEKVVDEEEYRDDDNDNDDDDDIDDEDDVGNLELESLPDSVVEVWATSHGADRRSPRVRVEHPRKNTTLR